MYVVRYSIVYRKHKLKYVLFTVYTQDMRTSQPLLIKECAHHGWHMTITYNIEIQAALFEAIT